MPIYVVGGNEFCLSLGNSEKKTTKNKPILAWSDPHLKNSFSKFVLLLCLRTSCWPNLQEESVCLSSHIPFPRNVITKMGWVDPTRAVNRLWSGGKQQAVAPRVPCWSFWSISQLHTKSPVWRLSGTCCFSFHYSQSLSVLIPETARSFQARVWRQKSKRGDRKNIPTNSSASDAKRIQTFPLPGGDMRNFFFEMKEGGGVVAVKAGVGIWCRWCGSLRLSEHSKRMIVGFIILLLSVMDFTDPESAARCCAAAAELCTTTGGFVVFPFPPPLLFLERHGSKCSWPECTRPM